MACPLLSIFKLFGLDSRYIHCCGSVSNLDHCICYYSLQTSAVHVDEDERDYDHLPLYFDIMVTSDIFSNQPSMSHERFEKRNWSSANMPLYVATLGALLSTVRVPFHLLCTNAYPIIGNASADLKRYYRDIIKEAHSCLYKEANHDNVKRSSVPVVAEGWGGMYFVARAPTKKPAKFHPPPTFPSWGKSGRKFQPTNPSPPLTLG